MSHTNIIGTPVAHLAPINDPDRPLGHLNDEQRAEVAADDVTGYTDVHFGLIPLDPTRNNGPVESRYVAAHVGDDEGHYAVMAFTNGDNFVEWGEPMSYNEYADGADENDRDHATGRFYNAPGLHVVVRFGLQHPIEPEYYPEGTKLPASNPTGLRTSEAVLSSMREREFFTLGIKAVEAAFADMLADGWRLCDYAALTDAADWSQPPLWAAGATVNMVGAYA